FVAKVGMGRAGSEDQIVVGEFLILRNQLLLFQIEIEHFFKQHFNVGVSAKDPTDWGCDLAGREAGGGNLIEQGLKSVVVLAVDDNYLGWKMSEALGCRQTAKTGADDHDPQLRLVIHPLI